MNEEILFKKAIFGGFNKKSVIDYIQQLKQTQQLNKTILAEKTTALTATMNENKLLREKNKTLSSEVTKYRDSYESFSKENRAMKVKLEALKKTLEKKLNGSDALKDLLETTNGKCDEMVEAANANAEKSLQKAAAKVEAAAAALDEAGNAEDAAKLRSLLIGLAK